MKQFVHLKRAWYGEVCLKNADYVDDVIFGLYDKQGGCIGEMGMRWYALNGTSGKDFGSQPTARLECFEDAFAVLSKFKELIKELGLVDSKNIQPKEFCAMLKRLGFKDMTPTKNKDEN